MKVFVNGVMLDENNAKISVFDRGFLYGDAVIETMRSYSGIVFRLNDHIERLFSSMKSMKIRQGLSNKETEKIIYELLRLNKLKDASIRVTMSRGISKNRGFNISQNEAASAVITAANFLPRPAKFYDSGIKTDISRYRKSSRSLVTRFKVSNYLESIIARNEAVSRNSFETFFLNESGHICEGTVSNVFMVKGSRLMTPSVDCGILPGITRKAVLELSSFAGVGVEEGMFKDDILNECDEVFITNSLIEIIPVIEVDGIRIGSGRVGPVTRNIHKLYRDTVKKETNS
ncbi:MAG: aminotransferase class IV [Candidatus Omnitrophica bacterium]|nr:aminotransferase class IV [Candidatus Omnitrophota bacterium]